VTWQKSKNGTDRKTKGCSEFVPGYCKNGCPKITFTGAGRRRYYQDLKSCDLSTGKELWSFANDTPGKVMFPGSRSFPSLDGNYISKLLINSYQGLCKT